MEKIKMLRFFMHQKSKNIVKSLLITGVLFMVSACTDSNNRTYPLNLSKDDYTILMKKSLITTGNNARLKGVITKLKNGEDVYIAVIGGSVTEGAGVRDADGKELWQLGYVYQFCNKLKEKYPKKNGENIHLDAAGLSGTPSTLGLLRYESDVVSELGHNPDLLIIEFAVNDDDSNFCERGFEGLIRRPMLENDDTAVIALFSDAKTYKNSQEIKKPIASFYQIPMISIQDAVENSGIVISEEDFFDDYVHPKEQGHTVMADALMNLISVVDESKIDEKNPVPDTNYNNQSLESIVRITGDDENVKIIPGSFNGTDENCQMIKKTGKSNFPQNWYKSSSAGSNEEFRLEINCRSLIFVYKEQGNWLSEKFGKADVFIDGKKFATYDGGKEGGWNNSVTQLVIDEKEASNHLVEVKMAGGDEEKGFTIVALAYCK